MRRSHNIIHNVVYEKLYNPLLRIYIGFITLPEFLANTGERQTRTRNTIFRCFPNGIFPATCTAITNKTNEYTDICRIFKQVVYTLKFTAYIYAVKYE